MLAAAFREACFIFRRLSHSPRCFPHGLRPCAQYFCHAAIAESSNPFSVLTPSTLPILFFLKPPKILHSWVIDFHSKYFYTLFVRYFIKSIGTKYLVHIYLVWFTFVYIYHIWFIMYHFVKHIVIKTRYIQVIINSRLWSCYSIWLCVE